MQREYFYKEHGQLKPYIYCSLCGAGPFKEKDKEQIEHVAGERQKIYYCKSCQFAQATKLNDEHEKENKLHKKIEVIVENDIKDENIEKVEEVISGNNDDSKLNKLTLEADGKMHTPLDGSFFILLVKSAIDRIFCLSCNYDANQYVNDLNTYKIEKSKRIMQRPLELVYKRSIEEKDKLLFERYLKVKPKMFKFKLIKNYNRTLQDLSPIVTEKLEELNVIKFE